MPLETQHKKGRRKWVLVNSSWSQKQLLWSCRNSGFIYHQCYKIRCKSHLQVAAIQGTETPKNWRSSKNSSCNFPLVNHQAPGQCPKFQPFSQSIHSLVLLSSNTCIQRGSFAFIWVSPATRDTADKRSSWTGDLFQASNQQLLSWLRSFGDTQSIFI